MSSLKEYYLPVSFSGFTVIIGDMKPKRRKTWEGEKCQHVNTTHIGKQKVWLHWECHKYETPAIKSTIIWNQRIIGIGCVFKNAMGLLTLFNWSGFAHGWGCPWRWHYASFSEKLQMNSVKLEDLVKWNESMYISVFISILYLFNSMLPLLLNLMIHPACLGGKEDGSSISSVKWYMVHLYSTFTMYITFTPTPFNG